MLVVVATLVACTPHPVGPARTFADYQAKARTTASSALSSVETVRLTAAAAAHDHAFGPYVAQVVSGREEPLDATAGTFASIQPPDERADELRDELEDLIGSALSHVASVRIAARRGTSAELARVAAPLEVDARRLRDFLEAQGG
jgi:hypothetical protein